MPYTSTHTGAQIDSLLDAALPSTTAASTYVALSQLLNLIYPVGSIYMSVNSTSPATLFEGTWEQIQDTFLLCAGSTYNAGDTGGNATHLHETQGHILTVTEMPSHTHTQYVWVYNGATNNNGGNRYGFGYSAQGTLTTGNSSANAEVQHWNANTGGNGSHTHGNTLSSSNLPPYLAVYVWKRTA